MSRSFVEDGLIGAVLAWAVVFIGSAVGSLLLWIALHN